MTALACNESIITKPDAFYFAAEAKAILAVRPELRSAIRAAWASSSPAVVSWRTARSFGGFMCCRRFGLDFSRRKLGEKARYFEPREWEEQEPLDAESTMASCETLSRALPRYFNGRERIGVSLTGGLDTRIIMAWRKAPPGALPCYTFGSMYRENQDVCLARRVAKSATNPIRSSLSDKIPGAVSALCRADALSDRRMRGHQPLRGPL